MAKKSTPKLQKLYCDRIWRKLITSSQFCQRCADTRGPFEAAHIVRRRFSWTRTDLDNGWCLCQPCHRTVDSVATEYYALVRKTIGMLALEELERKSLNRAKFDWFAEHERLKAVVKSTTA